MSESQQEFIVDYPPNQRPALVDSLAMTIKALRDGDLHVSDNHRYMYSAIWQEWAEEIATFVPSAAQRNIDYMRIQPGQPMIDCKPGSNRYAIFDTYKTVAYQNSIINKFAPAVHIPKQISASEFLDGRTIDGPFVFKDTESNNGLNKFLIEDAAQEAKLRKFLQTSYPSEDGYRDLMLEAFIETPTAVSTSYRYTMTPTGTILAASLLSAGNPANDRVDRKDTTPVFWPLIDRPDSPLYLGSRSITSNTAIGRTVVGLDFAERAMDLAPLNSAQGKLLEAHGISTTERTAPEEITRTARGIARSLGPSIGLVLGIDIVQQAGSSTPYFLEANSGPSNQNINETIHADHKPISPRELRSWGMSQTLEDLSR